MATPPPPGIDVFHKERSKCIDAFAIVELAVIDLLERAGTKFGGEPFGRKLDLLEKAKASPGYSKEQRLRVQSLLPRVRQLCEKRNDVVHSTLRLVTVEEVVRVQFTNIKNRDPSCERPLQLTLEGVRQLARDAYEITRCLRGE